MSPPLETRSVRFVSPQLGPRTNAAAPAGGGVKLSRSPGRNPKFLSEIRALHAGREASDHFLALKNVDAPAGMNDEPGAGEDMRAHVIAIGPYPLVRIIDEVDRVSQEIVEVVLSRRVRGCGNSEALV